MTSLLDFLLLLLLFFVVDGLVASFTLRSPPSSTIRRRATRQIALFGSDPVSSFAATVDTPTDADADDAPISTTKKTTSGWNDDDRMAHNAAEIHEETADELQESEMAAARDAHDCSDPGTEAAAHERAVMLANELIRDKKQQKSLAPSTPTADMTTGAWNDQHLAHGANEIHLETDEELWESEDAAAWDAHDCSDPGVEAAAEERAVMIAAELMEAMIKKRPTTKATKSTWNDQHVAHGANEIHLETDEELQESEDAAAWDAHDCSDPGVEAAAEERAVMIAAELMEAMMKQRKQKALNKKP